MDASVRSVRDGYDNALAETIGLFTSEKIHREPSVKRYSVRARYAPL